MSTSFRTLLDLVDTASTPRAIGHALSCFAQLHGFRRHAYLSLQDTRFQYFGDYPRAWREQYMQEKLVQVDPVIKKARRSTGPFFWSTSDWSPSVDQRLKTFTSDAINHGLSHGLTICARASFDRQLILSFTGPEPGAQVPRQYDLSDAVPLLMGLHYRLSTLRATVAATGTAPLSSRELLCLSWAAEGKTAYETGIINGLSTRTVQHYLDNARLKLGAATVPHLVAIAKDNRIL